MGSGGHNPFSGSPENARLMRAKTISIATAALVALVAPGCGDDESQTAPTVTVALPGTTSSSTTATTPAPPAGEPSSPAETPTEDPRVNELEREADGTVRRYIEALDARDGTAVCDLLAPDALDGIELPEPRGDCASAIEASIGYRDPRGLPVWEGATVPNVRVSEVDGRAAVVIATVVSHFADRDEASVEDDVVYLTRDGESWLIAKPSATLYRAVGIADIPPSILAPPS
jgi:hypothetical protein